MVEVTSNRCFILWTENKRGHISHDATAFTSAAAVINEGERQKDKGLIKDYNYSVVMCPQIGGEYALTPWNKKALTGAASQPSVQL